jgi:hypothetical protein
VTFRDDKDAMLARTEALDREVEELREENAKLRAERERLAAAAATTAARESAERAAAVDPRAVLEKLAAKAPKPRSTKKRKRGPVESQADRERRISLERAFTSPWTNFWIWPIAPVLVFGSLLGGAHLFDRLVPQAPGWLAALVLFVTTLVGLGLAVGSYELAVWHDGRRTRRWLARLALPLDRDRYIECIATKHGMMTVHVAIPDVPDAECALLERAVRGGSKVASARWDGRTLVITSPQLKYLFLAKGGFYAHNAKLHRWFRRLVTRVLAPIAASHRIERITFE